ncbi:MAG TPA: 50S ribosomal protein L1 [bacterium]|uniref:Large ribosomal subunit protein uL1 n=1 Tax=candidate division TA06 bacterium ADurb.Bin417 TaxID=1852828 RepID=A0A1V5MKA4_UNCT6|nr:MAG: 50S ribosomal protein L1 [candidate division TA06 bacterium ADurb.Bin417]HNQ35841.1 50S ribosomal protein L1 [bacterium]HNS48937.1 50S ribosomal protein L1 [bacterium]
MKKRSKRYQENSRKLTGDKTYTPVEALGLLKEAPAAKFDETVEISLRLGVDPKKSDQMVRGTAILPHGTGKSIRVLALVADNRMDEAREAGADFVGAQEYIPKIAGGWLDFDVAVTTPDMLREVAKLGKTLGPRGLMPSPKNGTVTTDIGRTIKELKSGRVEFRMDKNGNVHLVIGKISFEPASLLENFNAAMDALLASRPAAVKGAFIKKAYLSTTMSASLPLVLENK